MMLQAMHVKMLAEVYTSLSGQLLYGASISQLQTEQVSAVITERATTSKRNGLRYHDFNNLKKTVIPSDGATADRAATSASIENISAQGKVIQH